MYRVRESYCLPLPKRSSPRKIPCYKMTSSPPHSASSSLQRGSRAWLLATPPETGFWRAQRWEQLFACTTWRRSPQEPVFSSHLYTSRDANVKAMRLQPRNQAENKSLFFWRPENNYSLICRIHLVVVFFVCFGVVFFYLEDILV